MVKNALILLLGIVLAGAAFVAWPAKQPVPQVANPAFRVLVFSKTAGYRHASIEPGREALQKMGQQHGFAVDATEDGAAFTEENLRQYAAVVFLNTTQDVLDDAQQRHFEGYIRSGGGYVGIHAAADTEYDWPWYGRLVGGYFAGHPNNPNVREAVVRVVDAGHWATETLPDPWRRADEWYDYRDRNPDVHVLLTVDEQSYRGEIREDPHPVAWYHAFEGGRAFYTALGHTAESFSEPAYLEHLWGGLRYAAGEAAGANLGAPDESRFTKVVLDFNLDEPMELDLLPDGRVIFVERHGNVKIYDPVQEKTDVIATVNVFSKLEEGLLGVALDPNYATNHWVYFSYSAPDESEIRIARFVLEGTTLDFASEKIILEVPVQRDQCCHVAGSLEFDAAGNLYLSVGDNTNPFASDGFGPFDERPERSPWDAQKSSANTNDLRGKILRIHPEPDGTYTIPDGNLFPKDGSVGRPEVYVMGNRNPFRLAIDDHTGFLYWGEVGPDAGEDSPQRGPKGHDEVNQARQAGNFGWPFFVGNNKPYRDYNFETGQSGDPYDPAAPVNDSPNNTGARVLPPAKPAFIWYPYGPSPEFPVVGQGGRNAMTGPVFYVEDYGQTDHTFPAYYDGKLFTYDWIRGWIMAVTMNEAGDFVAMERFMPSTKFSNPIDMLFGPDGVMYLLEYGTAWNQQNIDARLSRIEFAASNRAPVAQIEADRSLGAAPLTVSFTGSASSDPDGDALTYAWSFGDGADGQATGAEAAFTYAKAGRYQAQLTVTDAEGLTATAVRDVLVGNDVPDVSIAITGNRTFFWDDQPFDYAVAVTDTEDGSLADGGIAPEQVTLTIDYLVQGVDLAIQAQGHQAAMEASAALVGKALIEGSDCMACHKADAPSIGPSYVAVAQRYREDAQALDKLTEKIIKGGGGVWGEQAMAAHPQLSTGQVEQMARYILSLGGDVTSVASAPLQGTYTPAERSDADDEGKYILTATYTDQGAAGIEPLTGRDIVFMRHPRVQAERFDTGENAMRFTVPEDVPGFDKPTDVVVGSDNGHIVFKGTDLTDVRALTARVALVPERTTGGRVEVRLGGPEGRPIGTFALPQTPETVGVKPYEISIEATQGVHDLAFVFVREGPGEGSVPVCAVDWIYFSNR